MTLQNRIFKNNPLSRQTLARGAGIISLLLFAFLLRCLRFREVIVGDHTYFFGTDPLYHMRRILLTLAHYPHVPVFDFFVNYPSGALVNWPPAFDFLLATFVWILGLGDPSPLLAERVCALSVPLLGTITVGVFYLLCRNLLPASQALFAALLLAFNGSHIFVSRIGRVDHHVLEVLLPAFALFFYFRSLNYTKNCRLWTACNVLCGAFFALSFLAWTGSTMFLGIFLLYAFSYQAFLIYKKTDSDLFNRGIRLVLFSTFLFLLPFCAASPWGKQGKILYLALSWFQVLVPFYGWIVFAVLNRFQKNFIAQRNGLFLYLFTLAGLSVLLLAITLAVQPETLKTLLDTWDFVVRKDTQIHTLGESRSLWGIKPMERAFFYGPLLELVPLTALYALLRPFWTRGTDPKNLLVLLWFLTTGAMATLQVRFSPAFSLPLCVYMTFLLQDVRRLLGRLGEKRGKPLLYRRLSIPLYLLVALASLSGALRQPRQALAPGLFAAFEDIALITPDVMHVWEPDKKPRYGILAHWNYGHHLNYLSHRPNIANPFGQAEWYLKGVKDSYRFLLAENEEKAVALCKQLEARYVLVSPSSRYLSCYAQYLALLDPDRLNGGKAKEYLRKHHTCIMNNRMLLNDGLAIKDSTLCGEPGPLKHFRLVYESAYQEKDRITGQQTSYFKLFEQVAGAHLSGHTAPYAPVSIEIPIRTNQNRTFLYTQSLLADKEGRFQTDLPYATEGRSLSCGPTGPYRISAPAMESNLHVSEEKVRSGRSLTVDLREK